MMAASSDTRTRAASVACCSAAEVGAARSQGDAAAGPGADRPRVRRRRHVPAVSPAQGAAQGDPPRPVDDRRRGQHLRRRVAAPSPAASRPDRRQPEQEVGAAASRIASRVIAGGDQEPRQLGGHVSRRMGRVRRSAGKAARLRPRRRSPASHAAARCRWCASPAAALSSAAVASDSHPPRSSCRSCRRFCRPDAGRRARAGSARSTARCCRRCPGLVRVRCTPPFQLIAELGGVEVTSILDARTVRSICGAAALAPTPGRCSHTPRRWRSKHSTR